MLCTTLAIIAIAATAAWLLLPDDTPARRLPDLFMSGIKSDRIARFVHRRDWH